MRKNLFLFLFAIVANSSLCSAQSLQTFEGEQVYPTLYELKVAGKEKFTYLIGENGERLIHGNYTFSGNNEISNNTNQLKNSYSVTTTCKNGKINGTFTSTGTIIGKTYHYLQGWETSNASTKFSAVFADGKPDGLFSIVINGETLAKGTFTMKNGKFVDAYNYEDLGIKLSGQLTAKGQLTGKWIHSDLEGTDNYVFENDVLILETNRNGVSTPASVQQVAKQYAAGKLTREQVETQGLVVKTEVLPLDKVLSDLILRDNDVTGLQQFPGKWEMPEYEAKKYTAIIKLNTITDDGFKHVLDEVVKTKKYNAVYHEAFNCRGYECETFCNSELHYDETCEAYFMVCGQKFNQLYGYYHESYSTAMEGIANIYVTKKQYEMLNNIKDSMLIESVPDFSEIFRNGYAKSELEPIYKSYRANANNIHKELTEKNVHRLYDISNTKYNEYMRELASPNGKVRFNSDSTHIIDATKSYDICAWKNEFDIWESFNEVLYNATLMADTIQLIQKEFKNQLYSDNTSEIKANIINQYNTSNQYTSNKTLQSKYNSINTTLSLLQKADSIARKNDYIIANVPGELLKNYKKEYKRVSSIKAKDTSITLAQYRELFTEISSLQEKVLKYNSQSEKAEVLNNEISEKCSAFPDILKPWQAKYKSGTVLTENIDKSLTDIEDVQKIGQNLLKYISLRQQCDSNSTAIISMCGKQYSDVVKPYQAKMKGMTFVPDMTSTEILDNNYVTLSEYVSYQKELLKYIQNRQKVDQLNQSIVEKIGKAKNVKKLYGVFYKSLSINWLADTDNFRTIEETVSLLQKTEVALQSNGADSFDGLLKKAKTAEDFKKVLNLQSNLR